MRAEPDHRIDPKALTVWRITGSLTASLYWLFALGFQLFQIYIKLPPPLSWLMSPWLAGALWFMAFLMSVIHIGIIPKVRWKRWRYLINEYEIELKYGVLVVKRSLTPMIRVQHVDTRQGPLLRYFDLASVTIHTAGSLHEIPALKEDVADALRDQISTLAREAREDV